MENDTERDRESEQEDEQVLTRLLENQPDIDKKIGLAPENNPRLEYIFQVPSRYYDNYQRQSRSVDQKSISSEGISSVLNKQKDMLKTLKTQNDEDLLLVQNIGSGLVGEIEERLNKNRVKRQQEKFWKR